MTKHAALSVICCLLNIFAISQDSNWHLSNFDDDSIFGIASYKAFEHLSGRLQSHPLIVAVIDDGLDTLQEDLQTKLWRNTNEYGNDEDRNGYVGDINGWNFLGGKNGENITDGGWEYKRMYFRLNGKYGLASKDVASSNKKEFDLWKELSRRVQKEASDRVSSLINYKNVIIHSDSVIQNALSKNIYYYDDIKDWKPSDNGTITAMNYVSGFFQQYPGKTNREFIATFSRTYDSAVAVYKNQFPADPTLKRKEIVRDNYADFTDRFYGNNNVTVTNLCMHGTHVAGIIGAQRNNGKGMDGIADAVRIMAVRVVPKDGDEYDKDVALGIRYAVDNGAKVINMSFGKAYSPDQQWVEEAIRYAEKHDVLIVHAAGNESQNIDSIPFYPTNVSLKKRKHFSNMITVGASSRNADNLIASFSNYGKNKVDVFAPGVEIYSTIPGNSYASLSGTSMASPVVAGVACLLRSYYPQLTGKQVKYIIENSVTKIDFPVKKPGSGQKVSMSDLCRSGGIVNAYNAVLLAEKISKR